MIQRIQSVWLFLASMVFGALFIFPLFNYDKPPVGLGPTVHLVEGAKQYLPLLIIASVITLLPMVAIFLFKNTQRQKGFIWLSLLLTIGFVMVAVMHISSLKENHPAPVNFAYSIPGMLLPFIAIILLFMAKGGIRKDEKLLRESNRLR